MPMSLVDGDDAFVAVIALGPMRTLRESKDPNVDKFLQSSEIGDAAVQGAVARVLAERPEWRELANSIAKAKLPIILVE